MIKAKNWKFIPHTHNTHIQLDIEIDIDRNKYIERNGGRVSSKTETKKKEIERKIEKDGEKMCQENGSVFVGERNFCEIQMNGIIGKERAKKKRDRKDSKEKFIKRWNIKKWGGGGGGRKQRIERKRKQNHQ